MNDINQLEWPLDKIINTANELKSRGASGASTSEQIAAAFVLNRQDYLPVSYTMIEAWERLNEWQTHVKLIRANYLHLITKNPG
jgi:hypothetical protein